MISAAHQIECKDVGCKLKGYWIETAPNGEKLYCHKVWHRGEQHTIKTPVSDIYEQIKPLSLGNSKVK